VAKAGVKLQIGFNRRFDTNFVRVRKAVADGEIGKPCLVHIVSRDPLPPPISFVRLSGGMFLDMTIHDFDMARFLTGDEVEEVYAQGGVMADPAIGELGDVDTAVVTLRYRGGAIGTIDNSRKAVFGHDQRGDPGNPRQNRDGEPLSQPGGGEHRKSRLQRPAAELFHGSLHGQFR